MAKFCKYGYNWFLVPEQCDQIWQFLKGQGANFLQEPKYFLQTIWALQKHYFYKKLVTFCTPSGHTVPELSLLNESLATLSVSNLKEKD